ncbi:MAG: DNA methyltransferase [Deltaproteobacteria bacterium HGW-Deltaproteobacteria-10]|nr:MAG: DNA methyltransferase [Deltaproteobacteria bacterium HGW-Deltaproteobacteria-10]
MNVNVHSDLFSPLDYANVPRANGLANKVDKDDRMFHEWYRFVLSFPPHLVRDYINKFRLKKDQTILDPFCGTGTTIVESKLQRINSIGIEPNPIAHFASCVKCDWSIDPDALVKHADYIAACVKKKINSSEPGSLRKLPSDSEDLLLTDSISPLPLHKALILLGQINNGTGLPFYNHELLALAKALVFSISNLHFGPEVGVHRNKKSDAPVVESWLSEINIMARDIYRADQNYTYSIVHKADSRQVSSLLEPNSIDAVFTSPPYPNEKDYTRTTRLESVILGFINNKQELQSLKRTLLRSNTRNVYKGDDDDIWVAQHAEIQRIADEIENKRISLGKTSGFEKLYGKVTKLYFGGMARHLAELRTFLKPGAYLGYVVGDQASYLQILIKTGELLADIAQSLGYEVVSLDLFRTRLATATRKQLREEVVVLRWPG